MRYRPARHVRPVVFTPSVAPAPAVPHQASPQPSAPLSASAGGPYTVTEGSALRLTASASGGSGTYGFAWDLDNSGSFATSGQSVSLSFPRAGTYPIAVRATDSQGVSSLATTTATVLNVPPTLSAPSDQGGTEATLGSFDLGSFSDPGGGNNLYAVDVDWGDGTPHTDFTVPAPGPLGSQPHTFAARAASPYTVTETVSDGDGGSDVKTFRVGVAPSIVPPAADGVPDPSAPPSVQLVSAAQYPSLDEALAQAPNLYIPPGAYEISNPLLISGRRGGVIEGAGRFTTRITFTGQGSLNISDSQDLEIANLSFSAPGLEPGGSAVAVTGPAASNVSFVSVTFQGGSITDSDQTDGGTALRIAAPGNYTVQGSHFFQSAVGLGIEDPAATVSVLGGNFQTDLVHIRQTAGHLDARSIGFQQALGGADVEIQAPAPGGPQLVEGCRSEGPDALLRVPATDQKVDVDLFSNGGSFQRLARYSAAGTLVAVGNNGGGIDALGAATLESFGNTLGNSFDPVAPFVLGAAASGRSTGDLWNTVKPGEPYHEPGNAILSPQAFADAGEAVPPNLSFGAGTIATAAALAAPTAYIAATIPQIRNIADLAINVKDFGALGDGQTDNSAAIARALAAARDQPIYFPAGRYMVSSPVLLDHWRGGGFWGDGADKSVIVSSSGQSAVQSNGCGYATFVDMGFETAPNSAAPAFSLAWDGSDAPDFGGGALQANMFYRCRFQGGAAGLSLGIGAMGSENLMVDCLFTHTGVGFIVQNYNALTNTALGCTFDDVDDAAREEAGSFNIYNSTIRNARLGGAVLRNSAGDTFTFSNLTLDSPVPLLLTGHTGAVINALIEATMFAPVSDPAGRSIVGYAAGGSVDFVGCALSNREIHLGGSIANSTLLEIASHQDDPAQAVVGGRGQEYIVDPQ